MKLLSAILASVAVFTGSGLGSPAERSGAEKQPIEKIEEAGGTVREIAQDDERLEVNFQLTGESVQDEHIAPVAELSNVYELRLGRTSVTDAGLAHIKDLESLNRLHLENTKITGAGLAHLADLTELTYLNLYGTEVSDTGLEHLQGLKNLKNLYVWQTKVTQDGAKKLEQALPGLNVEMGWDLAEVEATQEKQESQAEEEEN